MRDPTPTVYVLHWHDPEAPGMVRTEVYTDHAEAWRCNDGLPAWADDYRAHSGMTMRLAPDPRDGAASVAPEPGFWCTWSPAALAKRRAAMGEGTTP